MYLERIKISFNLTIRRETTLQKNRQKIWTEVSQKKVCEWQSTWKDSSCHRLLGKWQLRAHLPRTHSLKRLNCETLTMLSFGKEAERREPSRADAKAVTREDAKRRSGRKTGHRFSESSWGTESFQRAPNPTAGTLQSRTRPAGHTADGTRTLPKLRLPICRTGVRPLPQGCNFIYNNGVG